MKYLQKLAFPAIFCYNNQKPMYIHNTLRSLSSAVRLAAVPLLLIGVTGSLGFLFHVRGEQVVEELLRERMLSTVAIAAMQFDGDLVNQIHDERDMQRPAFIKLVTQLKTIRSLSPQMRFAYIMRRTDAPMTLSFVADADALSTPDELDFNKNGVVDEDEEPGLPGDLYPIDDIPTMQGPAFDGPVVESQTVVDQWGRLISAFAPIYDRSGNVVAILGMDIKADDFFSLTQNTFSLVAVALVSLLGTLLAIYILMIIRVRHLESLKQLDTERTALLDLASHQLGMPLATFRWWLEILKERDNGKFCKRGDVCDQLQEGIDRMDNIIRGLHAAGKLREDAFADGKARSLVPTVTKEVVAELQKALNLRRQHVNMHFEKKLPAVRLEQSLCVGMLRELVENASFYSPKGSAIDIRARAVRNGVELIVRDHGHGIPKDDIPHMFEQFKRGSNASKYKPAGNGLGLFIVRRIIERARGKIRISSELEKGTTVTLFLPLAA
jgi:signal transduction histidine kinase